MPVGKDYQMRLVASARVLKTEPRPKAPPRARVKPTPREVVQAFRKLRGYEHIVSRIPRAATLSGWVKGTEIAYFSVCSKAGSATYLDLWDCDHFDLVTDMQRSVNDCRAWFSHAGYSTWGSGQTATGRINCYFNAALAGDYSCVVKLQSYPISSSATVECLIDNNTYGPLPFTGTIIQPHFSSLSAGGHHFRIHQMDGSFYFLSLTVYRF